MKIAVVTGASSGIGREFAVSVSEKFTLDCIWLLGRNEERLLETASMVNCAAELITADLSYEKSLTVIEEKLKKEKPQIQLLVNAAGLGKFGSVGMQKIDDIKEIIDVNVRALTTVTKICIPFMAEGGFIVNMSSASAFTPLPYFSVYSASKAYVQSFSLSLAYELRGRGVNVITVCPYWVATNFIANAKESPDGYAVNNFLFITSPFRVVRHTLNDMRFGRRISFTGGISRVIYLLSRLLPVELRLDVWNRVRRLTLPDNQLPPEQWLRQ